MRFVLCLLLLFPGLALAGQAGPTDQPVLRSVPEQVASLPLTVRTVGRRPVTTRTVSADPASLCETAVTTAEYVQRLPPRLLAAISVTETGRLDPRTGAFRPWPWSINAEGEGQFFATAQDAIAAVKALQANGVQSIDVGCMQVNLMYHPHAFASLEDAFDPRKNALYAGQFLNQLYAAKKDWPQAIAAYHSETPALGDAYRVMVLARWQNPDLHAQTPPQTAYRDFLSTQGVYAAFAPSGRVYGAFLPVQPNR